MECPRCGEKMFRTQVLDVEHFGKLALRNCRTTNECVHCGVIISVFIPHHLVEIKEKEMEKKQTCPNCREPEMEEDNRKLTCPECGLELHEPKVKEQRIDIV